MNVTVEVTDQDIMTMTLINPLMSVDDLIDQVRVKDQTTTIPTPSEKDPPAHLPTQRDVPDLAPQIIKKSTDINPGIKCKTSKSNRKPTISQLLVCKLIIKGMDRMMGKYHTMHLYRNH